MRYNIATAKGTIFQIVVKYIYDLNCTMLTIFKCILQLY